MCLILGALFLCGEVCYCVKRLEGSVLGGGLEVFGWGRDLAAPASPLPVSRRRRCEEYNRPRVLTA